MRQYLAVPLVTGFLMQIESPVLIDQEKRT